METPATPAAPLDLFEVRHDLAAISSALRALRGTEGELSRDCERARRIFDLSIARLSEVMERLDRHLVPYDARVVK